jgi:hypothetical protein
MRERFEYVLNLQAWNNPTGKTVPAGLSLSTPQIGDHPALAELMLEAYRDTIDDEGETLTEAVDEVRRYLAPNATNRALLEPSVLLTNSTTIVFGLYPAPP